MTLECASINAEMGCWNLFYVGPIVC